MFKYIRFPTAAIVLALGLSAVPASAGTITFATAPCNGCGLNGFTGTIEGVGANGSFAATNLTVTGFDTAYFSINGGAVPSTPFSTVTFTSLSDLVSVAGVPADTVTLVNGNVTSINIDLFNPLPLGTALSLYRDSALEYVSLQVSSSGVAANIATSVAPGSVPLVNYTFSAGAATDVPEPMSMALVGAGLLGIGLVRRKSA